MKILQFIRNAFYGKPRVEETAQPKKHLTMQELISEIHTRVANLNVDLDKFEQGNKTAGKRARKTTFELEKLFREFRKRSVHEVPNKD